MWGASGQARSRVNELLGQNNPRKTRFPFVRAECDYYEYLLQFSFSFLKLQLLLLAQGIPCEGRRELTLAGGLWIGP